MDDAALRRRAADSGRIRASAKAFRWTCRGAISAPTSANKLLRARTRSYKGILPFLTDLEEKRYKQYIRVFLRQYQTANDVPVVQRHASLQPDALNVRVAGRTIAEVSALHDRCVTRVDASTRADAVRARSGGPHPARGASTACDFLCDVGLGYLSLDRATRTLSGGEAQRISLANSLGSRLVDTLYVLDEPSIGLHPRDMDRLLSLLRRLRDAGNTVLVVEHDLEAIRVGGPHDRARPRKR